MVLHPGDRVGTYEVIGTLGAGGMGEVYRARDLRLKRDVALKVLPESFAADPERLARFQREAEVLASLNHPNIAGVHGLEEDRVEGSTVRALVMELVEGPTLADLIATGSGLKAQGSGTKAQGSGLRAQGTGLPLEESLAIAKQIVEALEAAHERGIIHRDLKPANIKVRPDGLVKVLDFGLAKAIETVGGRQSAVGSESMSPTITSPALATGVGVLLGTAAYMSPEQAKGRAADTRSDIWAFGCLLFEMLTGTRAFTGEDVSDTLAAVLRAEPDWQALPHDTPRALVRLLRRCLERDPKQRLRDIGDARLDVQEMLSSPELAESSPAPMATPRPSIARRLVPVAATAAVTAAVVGLSFWTLTSSPPPLVQRFTIALPAGEVYTNTGRNVIAISPAGTHVVYGANNRLSLRPLDALDATPIRGTESAARMPFFSPDGQWIGFWQSRQLMKVALTGGAPVRICETDNPFGATWSDDGTIWYGMGPDGIWRVSAVGGQPEQVLKVAEGQSAHGPQLLPGGEWVLFTLRPTTAVTWGDAQLVVQSIRSGERRVVLQGGHDARYLRTGYLLYSSDETVYGIAFDLDTLQTTGTAVPLLEGVPNGSTATGASHFALADNGTLVYLADLGATRGTPVWVDRRGREDSAVTAASLPVVTHPRLSPDGRRLALTVQDDVWVYDLEGRPPLRLTHGGGNYAPVWTPDGERIIYETNAPFVLLSRRSDGSGDPSPVSPSGHYHPHAVTADGRALIVTSVDALATVATGSDTDIVRIAFGEGPEPVTEPLVATPSREGFEGVSLSPDGRWLAYSADTTGQLEIWVRPYRDAGAAVRVSPSGGVEPVWARNGRELFYLEGRRVMSVAMHAGSTLGFEPAAFLFETSHALNSQPPSYDVGPDGRFLMIKPTGDQRQAPPIVVVLNWTEELAGRLRVR